MNHFGFHDEEFPILPRSHLEPLGDSPIAFHQSIDPAIGKAHFFINEAKGAQENTIGAWEQGERPLERRHRRADQRRIGLDILLVRLLLRLLRLGGIVAQRVCQHDASSGPNGLHAEFAVTIITHESTPESGIIASSKLEYFLHFPDVLRFILF